MGSRVERRDLDICRRLFFRFEGDQMIICGATCKATARGGGYKNNNTSSRLSCSTRHDALVPIVL